MLIGLGLARLHPAPERDGTFRQFPLKSAKKRWLLGVGSLTLVRLRMTLLVRGETTSAVDCRFVIDSELGWGRYDPASVTIAFFDSPVRPEMILPSAGRAYKVTGLPAQQRVWWFDTERWIVGRVDSPRDAQGDAYFVHLPNGSTKVVPAYELRVRWSVPLAEPLGLLKAGTVETRFFHICRTTFLHSVMWQRSTSLGLGGILSAAVEIHDHQVGAARRVLADPIPRYLLADEVGLGKTIEAGMVLRQLLLDTPGTATVIVPDQIVGQWKRELATEVPGGLPSRDRGGRRALSHRIDPAGIGECSQLSTRPTDSPNG